MVRRLVMRRMHVTCDQHAVVNETRFASGDTIPFGDLPAVREAVFAVGEGAEVARGVVGETVGGHAHNHFLCLPACCMVGELRDFAKLIRIAGGYTYRRRAVIRRQPF